jgi:hypothetical protein
MIAGSCWLIDDPAAHAERTALLSGSPFQPSMQNHAIYSPLVEKYILMEDTLDQFYKS